MKNIILMLAKAEEMGVGADAKIRILPSIRRIERVLSNVLGEQLSARRKPVIKIDFRRLLIRAGIGLESNDEALVREIVNALYNSRHTNKDIAITSYEKRLLAIKDYVGYTLSFLSRVTGKEESYFKDITRASSDIVSITRR